MFVLLDKLLDINLFTEKSLCMKMFILGLLMVIKSPVQSRSSTIIEWFIKIIVHLYAAAAKSLQSCPTLWNPIDSSPPGSPIPGFSRQEHWSGLPFPSPIHESEKWKWSRSVVSNSSRTHGLQPTRLLCTWGFSGKSTGVGCHRLLRYTYILVYNRSIKYNLNSWKILSLQY